jgi:hypothetical protein
MIRYRISMYLTLEDGTHRHVFDIGRSQSFDRADKRVSAINEKLAAEGLLHFDDDTHETWESVPGALVAMFSVEEAGLVNGEPVGERDRGAVAGEVGR